MTDYTELMQRLRNPKTFDGRPAVSDGKEAADAIAALQAEVARLGQQTTGDFAQD